MDDENHYENQFIKGKDSHASIQNKVWNEDLPSEIKNYLNEIGLKNETFTANINVQRPGQMAPRSLILPAPVRLIPLPCAALSFPIASKKAN